MMVDASDLDRLRDVVSQVDARHAGARSSGGEGLARDDGGLRTRGSDRRGQGTGLD